MDTNNVEEYQAKQIESLAYFIGESIDNYVITTLEPYPRNVQLRVLEELSLHYKFPNDPLAQ